MLRRSPPACTHYRAIRLADGVAVAVKILRESADQRARDAFRREIVLLGQLRHAHVVELLDSEPTADRPYYVMPLMPGGCLTAWAGRLTAAQVRSTFAQVADAVAHIHAQGALHRDLKLDNVLVSAEGQCAVADFGLGNRVPAGLTMLLTVAALGTPGYMAPEIRTGRSAASSASDIYALGALLFHLVTGVHPNDASILDPEIYRSNTPPDLRNLILEMTRLVPVLRPTARVVLARVREPVRRQPAPPQQAGDGGGAAVVVGLLLLLGIGIAAAASD